MRTFPAECRDMARNTVATNIQFVYPSISARRNRTSGPAVPTGEIEIKMKNNLDINKDLKNLSLYFYSNKTNFIYSAWKPGLKGKSPSDFQIGIEVQLVHL